MDVIPWAIGLIAGIVQPSLQRAIALGAAASVTLRAYQYFLTEPRVWGHTMPEDLFGAVAMIAVVAAFAWVGSIVRVNRARRSEVTS